MRRRKTKKRYTTQIRANVDIRVVLELEEVAERENIPLGVVIERLYESFQQQRAR